MKRGSIYLLFAAILFYSCVRKFDEPPAFIQPDIAATSSIKALRALHSMGGFEKINSDMIISGIVVGDDKSGNLYKQICVQDSTAGITVNLGGNNLYVDYPVGRQVFIKCKGLWLSDNNRMIELGMIDSTMPASPSLSSIPSTLLDSFLVKGNFGNTVSPKLISINQLNDSIQSMLIQIKDSVQFVASDTALTYADVSAAKASVNRTISDCNGNKAVVYTSGYANFAAVKTPSSKGIINALYFVYKTTPELIIRDTSDVKFFAARCNAAPVSISAIRSFYNGVDVLLGAMTIKGIVISNATNIAAGNMIIQDGNSGIDLYFGNSTSTSKFNVGDSVFVDVTGGTLTSYKGMLEINLPATALPTAAIATGKNIVANVVTIAQLINNISTLENTLLQINNASASGGSGTSFSGNKTLADASGSTTLYTSFTANFAGNVLPITCNNWTGYANMYNTVQFQIRNMSDVISSTGCVANKNFTATYNFTSVTTTSGTTDPTTVPTAQNVSFSAFAAVGVGSNSSAAGRFSFSGWPLGATNGSNNFTGNLSATQYYEIIITPSSGYQFDLNSLTFILQRSSTGVRQWAVRSSVDNFASNLTASINPANNLLMANSNNIFQIADRATTTAQTGCSIAFGANHKNLTVPVKLRFYGFNAETNAGTFSLNNVTVNGNTH
ncbi:hypothetical protein GALL_149670 [mine drainage metagenome]|uniref:DUF5689 domain-containing protein n=1 Tax=mine drainage metagenome TaxID=410659 RepID=A0A1J5S3Y2_9ZZZZ